MSPEKDRTGNPEAPVAPVATVKHRIEQAKASPAVKVWDYVETDQAGKLLSVRCKLCGGVIYGKMAVGNPTMRKTKTDRETVLHLEQEVTYGPFSNYVTIEITHADGSKHTTPLCKTCATGPLTPETLEHIYAADLDRLGQRMTVEVSSEKAERFIADLGQRRPEAARIVAQAGE
jgi:hypothetical protein